MQLVRDIYAAKRAAGRPVISFEFFPPKTDEGDRALLEKTIPALLQTKPDYCSVTYGAGGSTRDKTLMIVERIQNEHGLTAVAHLTCVNSTREQIRDLLKQINALGVKNVLALRGEPAGGGEFTMTAGGFEFSSQLVQFIREQDGFCIGVAGFPEGHIACKEGKLVDWTHLKKKVDAGADFVITQLFFDNADFYRFRDAARAAGIKAPIVAGIMPILNVAQIKRFISMCGAKIPHPLLVKLEALENDAEATYAAGPFPDRFRDNATIRKWGWARPPARR